MIDVVVGAVSRAGGVYLSVKDIPWTGETYDKLLVLQPEAGLELAWRSNRGMSEQPRLRRCKIGPGTWMSRIAFPQGPLETAGGLSL